MATSVRVLAFKLFNMSKSMPKTKRQAIHRKYKGKCAYCGDKIEYSKMHVDHVVPLYRGWSCAELEKYNIIKGTSRMDNLNPSCPTCNMSKSTFTLEKWRLELNTKVERLRRDSSRFRLLEKHKLIKPTNKKVLFYFEKNK